jgi:hypothetical protein
MLKPQYCAGKLLNGQNALLVRNFSDGSRGAFSHGNMNLRRIDFDAATFFIAEITAHQMRSFLYTYVHAIEKLMLN